LTAAVDIIALALWVASQHLGLLVLPRPIILAQWYGKMSVTQVVGSFDGATA